MTEAGIVEGNLRVAMGGYSLVGESSDLQELGGLALTCCGLDAAVFNAAMPVRSEIDSVCLNDMIAAARQHYLGRSLGWTFWLCESLLTPEASAMQLALFRKFGMLPIAHPPGMLTEKLSGEARPVAGLSFRKVENEPTRLEFAYLSSVIFSLPFSTARKIYGLAGFWSGPVTGWIGYVEGKAVCIVTVVIGSGAAGVYSLGTLPGYQGKGFGEAILRHALDVCRQESGIEMTVLQTTRQGLKLYRRLGYRVVTSISVFLEEGCKPV